MEELAKKERRSENERRLRDKEDGTEEDLHCFRDVIVGACHRCQ